MHSTVDSPSVKTTINEQYAFLKTAQNIQTWLRLSVLVLCLGITSSNWAQGLFGDINAPAVEFLTVEEAFQGSITKQSKSFTVDWIIAPQYYLYKPRFSFSLIDEQTGAEQVLESPIYQREGKLKLDEVFGEILVYYNDVNIQIPFGDLPSGSVKLTVSYQGCAEAGLCYPPSTISKSFDTQALKSTSDDFRVGKESAQAPSESESSNTINNQLSDLDSTSIESLLASQNAVFALFIMFLLGIGLTFTPCILPMLPILSSIIVGQNTQPSNGGARRGFILSSVYVLGMALTYAAAGYLFGATGAKFQLLMQQPAVLWSFAAVFILLSFSMFGFYELQLPSGLQNRLSGIGDKQSGGQLTGVFIMGMVSALVASPCISAPLAGALIYIAQNGDPSFGALALLSLGFGIGTPMIILATTGANFLPKAGAWMNTIKAVFGVLLIFVAVFLVKHLLPTALLMIIWAALLILPAIALGGLEPASTSWQKFWKGVALMAIIYGAILMVGAASNNSDPFAPLANFQGQTNSSNSHVSSSHLNFITVRSLNELDTQLQLAQKNNKPVMLDYYADWCVACIKMEKTVFQDSTVADLLNEYAFIQVDLTNNSADNELLDRYGLIGPPSILFFDSATVSATRQYTEKKSARIVGEMNTEQFIRHLNTKVLPNR